MTEQCPSNFVRDGFLLGLDPGPADHVKSCPRCAEWLAAQARVAGKLAPRSLPVAPTRSRAGIVKLLLGLGLPVAAGATALLLSSPTPPTEIAKGGAIPVQIARLRDGAVAWVGPQDRLQANDSLRFFVGRSDAGDGYVLIGSVDGSERLSRFYPADADGCSVPLPAPGEALAGGIVLDGSVGPERMVVVVSHRPLCWPAVAEPVRLLALGAPPAGELTAADVHVTRLILPKQLEARR